MKRTIVFYLQDPKDLPDFYNYRDQWEITTAINSEHALQAITLAEVEAIVSDSNPEVATGMHFHNQVMHRRPEVTRVLLCNPADKTALKSDGSIHQYLPKPTSAEAVISAVQRARLVNHLLLRPEIKRLFTQMRKLPGVPSIYLRLLRKLQSDDYELSEIGEILGEDPALSAKVLQMVNSPFFGLRRPVSQPGEAVGHLGIERTRTLVLLAQASGNVTLDPKVPFTIDHLWRHSLNTGNIARKIVRYEAPKGEMAEQAFTAGVLHDVGMLMLAANLPEEYCQAAARAREQNVPFSVAEKELLGATHAEVGACVLGIWGLPAAIVEAVAFHHRPDQHEGKTFGPVAAVHVADVLEHELHSDKNDLPPEQVDTFYLRDIHFENRLDHWRKLCGETP